MRIESCPITGNTEAVPYLNLGEIPLVNNLCSTREESLTVKKYPLVVQLFPESGLSSLTETVPKEGLFTHYLYRSGVNAPYLIHCAEMYDYLEGYVNLENGGVVVDIGGNDGSLLKEFMNANPLIHCLNIDPCEEFMEENENAGIQYFDFFFKESTDLKPKANLITTTNVFQHNTDIRSFVKGIYNNLTYDGVWCLEFPYLLSTMIQDNYDQVYHEHVYYYRLKNIVDLLGQEGLKVINVSYHNIHAGTLRVISVRQENHIDVDSSVESFLNLESFMTEDCYLSWGQNIQNKIESFKTFIQTLSLDCNDVIIGFGASAKGCVFMNTCGFTDEDIACVIDDTKEKQGKFIPGTGIEIVSRIVLKTLTPDYIIILAHNFKDYIIKSLRDDGYEGKFIVMFPQIAII
jgi:novobiocin biosynthesis protein NovU/D-mycarose 3-C-methyltransferase